MYNKEIYDDWKLHIDATQYEIIYKFIDKTVKILSTSKLLDENQKQITDVDVLTRWKKVSLINLIDQLNKISNYPLTREKEDVFYDVLIYMAKSILLLRKNNIKINDLENVLEPKIFKYITSNASIDYINDFFKILLTDILSNEEIVIDENVKLSLKIEDTINIRSTLWNLENLCITFKDIVKWFKTNNDLDIEQKKYALNLMLIYYMSNFYIRYINDLNGNIINYNRIYISTTSFINNSIKGNSPFILICLKSIAIFLNLLIKKYNFGKNDSLIENYLSIINIYCSDSNIEKLKNIIFSETTNF